MSELHGFRRGFRAFIVFTIAVLCVFTFQQHRTQVSAKEVQNPFAVPVQDHPNHVVKRVAIAFGEDQPHNFSRPNYNVDSVVLRESTGHQRVRKRELTFFDAICKGEKHLYNIAHASLFSSEQGNKYTVQDLEDGGWTIDSTYPLRIPGPMLPALKACGVSDSADANKVRYANQDKEYEGVGGDRWESTQAQYYQVYNPSGKAILCPDNASPAHFFNMMRSARELPTIPEGSKEFSAAMPKISRWNDVVWAVWSDTAGDAASSLQYIFRDNIANDDTKRIMDEAVAPKMMIDLPWPGKTFTMEELGGQALLGTPHGAGIAWMLIDNINVLGKRTIEITAYSGKADNPNNLDTLRDKYYYYILFNLKP